MRNPAGRAGEPISWLDMESRVTALPLLRFSCSGCGYGASARSAPGRCPMCGSEGAWVEEGWKPFADLGHDLLAGTQHAAAEADTADADAADAPLRRDAEEPSVLPGIPLS